MPLPDYQSLARLLAYHIEPAECHGLLCGMLCADPSLTAENWLAAASRETTHASDTVSELRRLFTVTLDQLDSERFALHLLLPPDEQPLSERATTLGSWCQGFLAGLGLAGLDSLEAFDDEVREFIHDVSQIARVGFDHVTGDEDDEEAYSEIVEYVRIGVLLLHQSQRLRHHSHRLH
jgi:uncharacterized protein YgfB (UPF0149 family)